MNSATGVTTDSAQSASGASATAANATTITTTSVLPEALQPIPDGRRPDKVHPYKLSFWAEVIGDDNTSEMMNVLGMLLSMVGILMKYKTCAWLGVLVAAVSYGNARANMDAKQIMSTFMLSMSAVIMCYLANPQPISVYLMTGPTTTTTTPSVGS